MHAPSSSSIFIKLWCIYMYDAIDNGHVKRTAKSRAAEVNSLNMHKLPFNKWPEYEAIHDCATPDRRKCFLHLMLVLSCSSALLITTHVTLQNAQVYKLILNSDWSKVMWFQQLPTHSGSKSLSGPLGCLGGPTLRGSSLGCSLSRLPPAVTPSRHFSQLQWHKINIIFTHSHISIQCPNTTYKAAITMNQTFTINIRLVPDPFTQVHYQHIIVWTSLVLGPTATSSLLSVFILQSSMRPGNKIGNWLDQKLCDERLGLFEA